MRLLRRMLADEAAGNDGDAVELEIDVGDFRNFPSIGGGGVEDAVNQIL